MLNKITFFCCALVILLIPAQAQAQAKRRSPLTIGGGSPQPLNSFPCGGDSLFAEDFENGLPSGWVVLDLDGQTPHVNTGLNPGWQILTDYQDASNTLMASPSWYDSTASSDDWLITPQVTLGNNPCLSWMAYSVDQYFPEVYEVRISTTTPDTAGFFAHPAVYSDSSLGDAPDLYSLSLTAYAGQQVYLAFRQISDDKFVMALDDVLITEANTLDVGVVEAYPSSANKGDSVVIRGVVRNFGSDTVQNLTVKYQIETGSIFSVNLDSLDLAPNGSVSFNHPAVWVTDTLDAFVQLCVWSSAPNAQFDDEPANDSTCISVAVGSPVSVDPRAEDLPIGKIYPNPSQGQIYLDLGDLPAAKSLHCRIYDSRMVALRAMQVSGGQSRTAIDLSDLPAGMYFLHLQAEGYRPVVQKLILR